MVYVKLLKDVAEGGAITTRSEGATVRGAKVQCDGPRSDGPVRGSEVRRTIAPSDWTFAPSDWTFAPSPPRTIEPP